MVFLFAAERGGERAGVCESLECLLTTFVKLILSADVKTFNRVDFVKFFVPSNFSKLKFRANLDFKYTVVNWSRIFWVERLKAILVSFF